MTDNLGIDIYEGDGNYDLDKLAAAGRPWVLVMLKATQGTYYNGGSWLRSMWPKAATCWGARYGVDGFRVPYHYLDVALDGAAQARYHLEQVSAAGGLDHGVPFLVVDLERGGQRRAFSKADIVACAKNYVAEAHSESGLEIVCYGGEYLRSNGIKLADIGCVYGWVADYEDALLPTVYNSIGCPLADLMGWQYAGVEGAGKVDVHLKGYPWTTPAGPADINALLADGGGEAAVSLLASWCKR